MGEASIEKEFKSLDIISHTTTTSEEKKNEEVFFF